MSNPCLELWFVWHFADQTAYVERGDVQRRAKELLGSGKSLADNALAQLTEETRYEVAKQRAQRMDLRHKGDGSSPGANPSSTMYLLIDRIRGCRATERPGP